MDRAEGFSGPSGPWGAGVRSQAGPCPRLGFRPCPCPLLPAKELSAQPLPTAVPREAPGLEETKAAGTYLGCKEGVGRGRGSPLTPGSRASRLPPRAALLRSGPQPRARCRPGAAAGEGARVRVCVCARVCAAGSLQHLCAEMRSSLCRRRSLAGWVSAWRRAPAPPFPSSPASPHLLPEFKGRAASSARLRLLSAPAPPGLRPRPSCPAPR